MTNFIKEEESNSLKDYLNLIRNNIVPISLIVLTSLIVSIIYAIGAKDIYTSVASLKISKPQGSILESPILPEFSDYGSDRFIANEIEILKSYTTRQKVAEALMDSFAVFNSAEKFYLLLRHEFDSKEDQHLLQSTDDIISLLANVVTIEQKRGLDIVDITVESPSAFEAALIANSYSSIYKSLNLEINRNQLTLVKEFLQQQKNEKQLELNQAEELLQSFQEKGGIIALDEQASVLINQISQFEAQKNAAEIDIQSTDKVLKNLKEALVKQDPKMAEYLESLSTESLFKAMQDQLAKYQLNRDMALTDKNINSENSPVIKEYDRKIKELQEKINEKLKVIKAGIFASSPDEVKQISQKILEAEVKTQSLKASMNVLDTILKNYDTKFNQLPKTSIEFARLQRNRESLEKLYVLVEERYQEALINEQSQPGNVLMIDSARKNEHPSKPNRLLIVLVGLVLGVGIAFAYIFVRNYFDNTVKTPDDMQNRNINVLSWIPQIEGVGLNGSKELEFIVAKKPDSIPSEAFRAMRTRIQFSKIEKDSLKTILITSSAPREGKTTIAVNLAGSYAQSNKKTLLLDCDLRKPRVHSIFAAQRYPGLIDYLFEQVKLEDIIRPTGMSNLSFISAGTIPPNPAEMLDSQQMKDFLQLMKNQFDIIIVDSPPIIAVTDSEILSTITDGSILVVSADATELDLLEKSVQLIKNSGSSFLGTVLNNFSYKSGYGSYYKYYYYYSRTHGEIKPPAKV
ncbi:MAG TPA: polysaccharide biosynthesis tyrosine autokinase [Ignavibacteriaceae bacterium]|nr:polysaccharide biosynthesis tyrosine autokinase [Ignavibacteriaceae bacterium]